MSTPARAPSRRPSPRPVPKSAPKPTPPGSARVARSSAATAAATAPRRERAPRRDDAARELEQRPNLEVVSPERRRTLRLRLLGGVACLLLFGALLGLAIFHSVLVQGQLRLDGMEEQIEAEHELQRSLRKDYAELASPERIVAEALRLGMVLPDERTYLQAVVPGQNVPPPGADR